jgi:DNA-directed RNA polymerase specialized sigma24 family protein
MLCESSAVQRSLRWMIRHEFQTHAGLEDDLMQEALLHLLQVEQTNPGHNRRWCLRNCWFHLQHHLRSGHSVDSPKRAAMRLSWREWTDGNGQSVNESLPDGSEVAAVVACVHTRHVASAVGSLLRAQDRTVFAYLLQGYSVSEVARKLELSRKFVYGSRHRIAATAASLGLSPRR